MKIKTQAHFAEEVRAEHLATAASTPDAELKEWSIRIYNEVKAADTALLAARTKAQEVTAAREQARMVHRRNSTPETTAVWRARVVEVEAANTVVRTARDHRNYLGALSEFLATLLRERRNANAGNNNSNQIDNTDDSAAGTSNATATAIATTVKAAVVEGCPFCTHSYTVRDGTLPQLDAEGNRLQLRKCVCREMAPPCKNCPTCKQSAALMKADSREQLRMCREELKCEICACECPGAGKWIQGDETSRAKFRDRTARRHAELSALLQGSWDDTAGAVGGGGGGGGGGTATATTTLAGPSMLRRLPADIKDQIIAARAAESLFSALDSTAVEGGGGGGGGGGELGGTRSSGAATTSAQGGTACGRMCCGEAITTVKRRHIDTSNTSNEDTGRPRRRSRLVQANTKEEPSVLRPTDAVGGEDTADGHHHQHQHHQHQHHHDEGCGDHCNHNEHHHHHVHRCEHPHEECDSDCCSAISHS